MFHPWTSTRSIKFSVFFFFFFLISTSFKEIIKSVDNFSSLRIHILSTVALSHLTNVLPLKYRSPVVSVIFSLVDRLDSPSLCLASYPKLGPSKFSLVKRFSISLNETRRRQREKDDGRR